MKICKTCNVEKEEDSFYRNRGSRLASCKQCCYEKELKYFSDPDNRLKKRKTTIKRKYGLSFEDYVKMLESQSYSCKICNKALEENGSKDIKPHIDHCHSTGRVRGVLCSYCNTMLGVFNDDPEYFYKAINYLKGSDEKETETNR